MNNSIIEQLKGIQQQIYHAAEAGCISLLQPEGELKIWYSAPDYKPRIQSFHMLGNPLINYLKVKDGQLLVNYWYPGQDQNIFDPVKPDKDDLLQIFEQLYNYMMHENI